VKFELDCLLAEDSRATIRQALDLDFNLLSIAVIVTLLVQGDQFEIQRALRAFLYPSHI
jgi:hypothetical protein